MPLPILVRTLPKPIPPRMSVNLEGVSLLPLLFGFSQSLSMRVSRSRRAADEMVLRGARRWQELQSAAPRLRASLEQLLADDPNSRLLQSQDLAMIHALIEFCLGWMMCLLEQMAHLQFSSFSSPPGQNPFPHTFLTLYVAGRKCPIPT